jgi:hypothetical protein
MCTSSAENLKLEIRKIQMQRKVARQKYSATVLQMQNALETRQSILMGATESLRRNSRAVYSETLEDLLGPCRLAEESRLLELSHKIEISERQLELMVQQYRSLTEYMVDEIKFLEAERKEIQIRHNSKYEALLSEVTRLTNSFQSGSKHADVSRNVSTPRRRSTCFTQRRISGISHMSSMSYCEGDDDDLSVISDLSMSVTSVHSATACKSIATEGTTRTGNEFVEEDEEEYERFTVIRL